MIIKKFILEAMQKNLDFDILMFEKKTNSNRNERIYLVDLTDSYFIRTWPSGKPGKKKIENRGHLIRFTHHYLYLFINFWLLYHK